MNALKVTTFLGLSLGAIAGLLTQTVRAADINPNSAMLDYCNTNGISAAACSCWFTQMTHAEGFTEFSPSDIAELAPYYQEELKTCVQDNAAE